MKTIGLIGGMSWESTMPYYRVINETIGERLGGLHSAKVILYSVDFYEIEQLQRSNQWALAGSILAQAAQSLQLAGAECVVLCTNTMHKVADIIARAINIPFLHIVDPSAEVIRHSGLTTVGLLGTRFTMEQDFYKDKLLKDFGIKVIIPDEADRSTVHDIIFTELCLGRVLTQSRQEYQRIIKQLVAEGAQGILLGCTEISMLIGPEDATVPLFDTTSIHARKAAEWSLSDRVIA